MGKLLFSNTHTFLLIVFLNPTIRVAVVNEMQYNHSASDHHTSQQSASHAGNRIASYFIIQELSARVAIFADTSKAPHEITVSYDSFSCQLKTSSCQSTPAKSPLMGSREWNFFNMQTNLKFYRFMLADG